MVKIDVLNLLAERPDMDAATVAAYFNGSRESAGMILLRLNRQGLISRSLDPDQRVLFYALTSKGFDRLRYLLERAMKKEED